VRATLHDGREIVGTLSAFDRHLNLVLVDAEEFRTLKRRTETEPREVKRSLGLLLLRGESVVHVFPEAPPAKDTKAAAIGASGNLGLGTASIVDSR
jgi:small nuclear ribonucleoprotein B and B'